MSEKIKASVKLRAESYQQMVDALARIIMDEFGGQIVQNADVSASIKLEANDPSDLLDAIMDVQRGVAMSDGVTSQVNAPGLIFDGIRAAGPTPMEKMINDQVMGITELFGERKRA